MHFHSNPYYYVLPYLMIKNKDCSPQHSYIHMQITPAQPAHVSYMHAKQKHPGCKKVRGQSEAALQIGMCDQNL